MTREEAKGNLMHAIKWNDMPKKEALEMAIKALSQEPCEDAISRQAVLDRKYVVEVKNMWHMTEEIEVVNVDDIKALPPVNPQEPKTGHWIKTTDEEGYTVWVCDKCGSRQIFNTHFCICGAKMTEKEKGERNGSSNT